MRSPLMWAGNGRHKRRGFATRQIAAEKKAMMRNKRKEEAWSTLKRLLDLRKRRKRKVLLLEKDSKEKAKPRRRAG